MSALLPFDVGCASELGLQLFWGTTLRALPMIIVLRNGGVLGALQPPTSLVIALCSVISLTLAVPASGLVFCDDASVGAALVANLADAPVAARGATALLLPRAALEGTIFALVIRQALMVTESIAGSLENQLQLASDPKRGSPTSALTTLCLALFAARWWTHPDLRFALVDEHSLEIHMLIALDAVFWTLQRAFALVLLSGLVLLCGELAVAAFQRVLPNVISWQFSLPLRLALALAIFRVVVLGQNDLGGAP